jgi:polyferredoxin
MLMPVLVSFLKGRFWCGNFCPRGSFNDIILSKFSRKVSIPKFMKTVKFKNTFLVILLSGFVIQLSLNFGDLKSMGYVFVRMILITTLLGIGLGILYKPRTWCTICPMGTISQHISKRNSIKNKIQHVNFSQDKCVNCKICNKHCPLEIDVHSHKSKGKVTNASCIKCNVCVDKCPKDSLYIA